MCNHWRNIFELSGLFDSLGGLVKFFRVWRNRKVAGLRFARGISTQTDTIGFGNEKWRSFTDYEILEVEKHHIYYFNPVACIIQLITRSIVLHITPLTVLFCNCPLLCNCCSFICNCPLLKNISFNTNCFFVWCD